MSDARSKRLQPEEYFRQHYEQGFRPDGRTGLTTLRPVSISTGSISTSACIEYFFPTKKVNFRALNTV